MAEAKSSTSAPVEFRDIRDFPGYQISNDGQARCCLRRKSRLPLPPGEWRFLRRAPNAHGYIMVSLFRDGNTYIRYAHRLVLEAFVGPCPDGLEACHNNGNPADNRVENLRWDTKSSNQRDRALHGTSNQGVRQHMAKVKDEFIPIIRKLYEIGVLQSQIAEGFGIHQVGVSCIVTGKTWKHVPESEG